MWCADISRFRYACRRSVCGFCQGIRLTLRKRKNVPGFLKFFTYKKQALSKNAEKKFAARADFFNRQSRLRLLIEPGVIRRGGEIANPRSKLVSDSITKYLQCMRHHTHIGLQLFLVLATLVAPCADVLRGSHGDLTHGVSCLHTATTSEEPAAGHSGEWHTDVCACPCHAPMFVTTACTLPTGKLFLRFIPCEATPSHAGTLPDIFHPPVLS